MFSESRKAGVGVILVFPALEVFHGTQQGSRFYPQAEDKVIGGCDRCIGMNSKMFSVSDRKALAVAVALGQSVLTCKLGCHV